MDGRQGYIGYATHGSTLRDASVGTGECVLIDEANRLVRFASGAVLQIDSLDDFYPTEQAALMAAAEKMAIRAGELQAIADKARAQAAEIAAKASVTVCST